jgi:ankyrin repeat protein/truncated hemoglobin YjbI
MDNLDHRLGGYAEIEWQQPDASLLDRLGGDAGLDAIVEAFYDGVERDSTLVTIFPRRPQRDPLKRFLRDWLGGRKGTAGSHNAGRGQRRLHCPFVITSDSATRWLRCMGNALQASGIEATVAHELLGHLGPAARGLVNARTGDAPTRYLHPHCGDKRALTWAKAAARGDLAALQAGVADIPALATERGPDGRTLLWEAARNGRLEVIDFLLEHGGDVNAPGAVTKTSFFPQPLAEPRDTLVMVTPYCLARWRGYDDLAEHLLDHGARPDIFTAAFLGRVAILTSLLDRCPEAVAVTDPADDYFGSTLLMHAVAGCQYEVAQFLIDRGAQVHNHSRTLLTYAVTRNHLPLVELLLDNGAQASRSAALGPLTGDMAIARRLCDSGYSIDDHGLLGRACRADVSRSDPDIVRRLINLGASADHQGALHGAALGNMIELVDVLLECGAAPNAVDEDGRTPLHHLHATRAKTASLEVITHLLDRGAAIDALDHSGTTSLCHAVRRSRVEAVKLLLARGADPDRHGPGGKSPRLAARRGKHPRNAAIRALLDVRTPA